MVLIERLSDKGLNYRLATHVQLGGGMVEFLQHRGCEIDIDPLNRLHHLATVGEETRNILPAVRHLGDGLSRNVLLGFTRLHHIVFAHFEDERIQSTLRPSNRAVLFRIVQTLVEIVGMSKDLLRLFEADPSVRVLLQLLASCLAVPKAHPNRYSCYTIWAVLPDYGQRRREVKTIGARLVSRIPA